MLCPRALCHQCQRQCQCQQPLLPLSIHTDARVPDPDVSWKVNFRKRFEHDLLHLVEDVQILRDTTLSTHLSENNRSRFQRDYEGCMDDIRALAE